ncbi:hypothetical protein FLK61_28815 [Paenalkalicoccus suaedae]|uniref:Uncharacterized protein n=2 Tax=Paenalkalicoccus suaedae TaxID=2592382 RepID=A0A859FBK7_9BACI|nr:hypothetical protein FLK61_28815 [Paenalkalicoccus suaedae]
MNELTLENMTYGQFQQQLVELVLDKMKASGERTPLLFFPTVLERVESYLLVHWKEAWEDCRGLTWAEWQESKCATKFNEEVVVEFTKDEIKATARELGGDDFIQQTT